MVNASKNLFDAVDKEFKEQPTQLTTENSGYAQFHPLIHSTEHSRKAGLTLVRDSKTRIEYPNNAPNRLVSHSMYTNKLNQRMTINHGTSEQNMRKNQAYFGGS